MQGDQEQQAEVQRWTANLEVMHSRIAKRFVRAEPRFRVLAYLEGLLSPIERKNGWQLAEHAGNITPDGIQRLLTTAQWDADLVRDDLQTYVIESLGDPHAVLVVDEIRFLKKGTKSVGVERKFNRMTGRFENCQIGIFLAYASSAGWTFFDRELYLPKSWSENSERCRQAGIPDTVKFRRRPQLAMAMIERVKASGVSVPWVTADDVFGKSQPLRMVLQSENQSYILAIHSSDLVDISRNSRSQSMIAAEVGLDIETWSRLNAREGAKGLWLNKWGLVPLEDRSFGNSDPNDLGYYLVFGDKSTSLEEMVTVVGSRWAIKETIETAKGEVGLDQYEVRHWKSWYRHITLAMLAHACLTVSRAQAAQHIREKGDS